MTPRLMLLPLAFALVATVTFAAAEAEEAAAAEKEMVLDPTTGEMITAPEYGGTLIYGRTGTGEHCDAWANSGWSHHFVGVVTEQLTIANWGIDRSEDDLRVFSYPLSTMKGQLAERWEAPDATTFIAHIRPGVRWHDKAPMNGREADRQTTSSSTIIASWGSAAASAKPRRTPANTPRWNR